MIQMLEIGVNIAVIIAIALPLIAFSLCILIIPSLRNSSGSRLRRYLSYLITPPMIGSLKSNKPDSLKRQIKVRLFFLYLGIAIFLISFMISEFYQAILDIMLPVTQGSTGAERIVSSVVFQSPFSAGWIGSLPWYGALPLPGIFGTYHEPWRWIFATAAFTDNPYFMETMLTVMLLFSVISGIVFLLPLASKTIRHSFLPSIFFLMVSMILFSKSAIDAVAQTCSLLFFDGQVQMGLIVVTGDMIPNLIQGILYGIPILLAMFALFSLIGWKLWKEHYPDTQSRNWFMLFIALSFWGGLALTIFVA
jgi:hypothetical protein